VALTSAFVTSSILSAAPEMAGPTGAILAQTVGAVVVPWALTPSNLILVGVTTGTLGVGVVNGVFTVLPNMPVVSAALSAAGVVGPTAIILAKAIAFGIATSFSVAQYSGPSTGVGAGVDTSVVSFVNAATLVASLSASFLGVSSPLVSAGLGNGIAALLALGTGIGVVTGTVLPGAGAGVSGPSFVF
jgi:hypothetical protein